MTGGLLLVTPMLLGAFLATGVSLVEIAMYGICVMASLPYLGQFAASLRREPANLLLVLLFMTLAIATGAAFARVPPAEATLQAKALAATAVWASIFIVVFSSVKTPADVLRFMQWVHVTCLVVTASVYVSLIGHHLGFEFGEVLEFRDGRIRVFGPLGDHVGFVLVLPALMSLAASRPVMFGVHLGALLLTATRGAVVCLILGVVTYVFVSASARARLRQPRRVSVVVFLLVGALVWLTPLSGVLTDRLRDESVITGTFRVTAIEIGARVFRDNAILGLGFNGFGAVRPAVYDDWINPAAAENGLSRTANQYLQTATDGGVLALLLLVAFVLCIGRAALRVATSRDAAPGLVASQLWLIAVMVGNQGALWLLSDTATGFFVFAVAGITARMSRLEPGWRAGVPAPSAYS